MGINGLQKELRRKNIDAVILLSSKNFDPNIFYFTGIDYKHIFLIIPKKGKAVVFTSELEYERTKRNSIIKNIKKYDRKNLKKISKFIKGKTIGINKDIITLNEFKFLKKYFKKREWKDIFLILNKLREQKTEKEIFLLKKSADIVGRIMNRCIRNFKRFKTEKQVIDFLDNETKKYNCKFAFQPIVASGKNSSMPHYEECSNKIQKGFCVIDFGVNYKGYNSDMTRTIYVGKPAEREIYEYNKLLDAQKKAINSIKIGKKCSSIDKICRKALGKNFIHASGHGVGLEIHELPSISEKSKDIILESTVFTIEPGIYFENRFGIRIEDMVLVRKNKVEVLTRVNKELITI